MGCFLKDDNKYKVRISGSSKEKDPENYNVCVRTYIVWNTSPGSAAVLAGGNFRHEVGKGFLIDEVLVHREREGEGEDNV